MSIFKDMQAPNNLRACMPVPTLMGFYVFLKHNKFVFKVTGYFSGLFFLHSGSSYMVTKGSEIENPKLTAECCMLAFSEH